MKNKIYSSFAFCVLVLASFAARADTLVANANTAYNGCTWNLTYSSGGGGAPQFYDLNCSGTKVVTQQKVGGSCNFYSVVSGYRLSGSGCDTQVYRIESSSSSSSAQACTSANKGKTYFTGVNYVAQSILQSGSAQTYCGDCAVIVSGSNTYGSTQTISCSNYK